MAAPLLSPREWTDLWQALKDYLTANAEAMAAEADDQEDQWPSLELAPVLRARSEIFALVRQHMGEMEAAGTPAPGEGSP